MENEKIKVVIFDRRCDNITLIELTPEQVKLLDWLDSYGFLDDYEINTDIHFESV